MTDTFIPWMIKNMPHLPNVFVDLKYLCIQSPFYKKFHVSADTAWKPFKIFGRRQPHREERKLRDKSIVRVTTPQWAVSQNSLLDQTTWKVKWFASFSRGFNSRDTLLQETLNFLGPLSFPSNCLRKAYDCAVNLRNESCNRGHTLTSLGTVAHDPNTKNCMKHFRSTRHPVQRVTWQWLLAKWIHFEMWLSHQKSSFLALLWGIHWGHTYISMTHLLRLHYLFLYHHNNFSGTHKVACHGKQKWWQQKTVFIFFLFGKVKQKTKNKKKTFSSREKKKRTKVN